MDEINDRLNRIEDKLDKLTKLCEKMSDHIDFVDNVYVNVKAPMEWICNKFNYIENSTDKKYLEEK